MFPGPSVSSLANQVLFLTKSSFTEASVIHMPTQQDDLKFPFLRISSCPLYPRKEKSAGTQPPYVASLPHPSKPSHVTYSNTFCGSLTRNIQKQTASTFDLPLIPIVKG